MLRQGADVWLSLSLRSPTVFRQTGEGLESQRKQAFGDCGHLYPSNRINETTLQHDVRREGEGRALQTAQHRENLEVRQIYSLVEAKTNTLHNQPADVLVL